MSTVLFLDVDGVLNPFRAHHPHKWSRQYRKHPIPVGGEGFMRPWVSAEHGARLLALKPSVKIVWATTWVWYPDELEIYAEASGLPSGLDRIEFTAQEHDDSLGGRSGCGKLDGIQRWLNVHGLPDRIIWCDDLLGPRDYEWATRTTEQHTCPVQTFKPDQAVGLRPADFDSMQKFLDNS